MNSKKATKELEQVTSNPKDDERMCAVCLQNVKRGEYVNHIEAHGYQVFRVRGEG